MIVSAAVGCLRLGAVCGRDLDKQEAEIKEKLKQEKKREERKNREAFSELLREDMEEGFIKPKMRWRVCLCLRVSRLMLLLLNSNHTASAALYAPICMAYANLAIPSEVKQISYTRFSLLYSAACALSRLMCA